MKEKKSLKRLSAALFSVVMLALSALPASTAEAIANPSNMPSDSNMYITSRESYYLAPGITEEAVTINSADGDAQMAGYSVKIDLSLDTTSILVSYKDYMNSLSSASWGMQTVRNQITAAEAYYRQSDESFNVVAGINGDFFNMSTGAPTGTLVMSSNVYNINAGWAYFAILKDGTPVIREGGGDVSDVKEAVGGPGIIVKNGELTEDAKTGSYGAIRNPRSAVGITADGQVVFFESDGRQNPYSVGMTYVELANAMLSMGCVDALSLDGGGSSTFLTQRELGGETVLRNKPSDGTERPVSTSVLICSTANPEDYTFQNNTEHRHTYTYNNGDLVCGGCNVITSIYGYTGLAADSATGLPMYFINGRATIGWFALGRDNYFFNARGIARTGAVTEGSYTYTFGEDGRLTRGALNPSAGGICYYLNGTKQRGWYFYDGSYHYCNRSSSYKIATGRYTIESNNIAAKTYTFSSDGALTGGAWYGTGDKVQYYWGPNPVVGWQLIGGSIYYFDIPSACRVTGSQTIDGRECLFAEDGKLISMVYGVIEIDGVSYLYGEDGGRIERHSDDHDYVKAYDEPVEATCMATGLTRGEHCAVCGEITAPGLETPLAGHSFSQWETATAPTCTDSGEETRACIHCGETEARTAAPLGHDFDTSWTIDRAATADTDGEMSHHCSRCSERGDITPFAMGEEPSEAETEPSQPQRLRPKAGSGIVLYDAVGLIMLPQELTGTGAADSFDNEHVVILSAEGDTILSGAVGTGAYVLLLDDSGNELVRLTAVVAMDVNGDGRVTAADARLALRASARLIQLEGVYSIAADADESDIVTSADARRILRFSAKLS